MGDQNGPRPVVVKDKPMTFIKDNNELTKLLKRLEKATTKAVDVIEDIMESSKDEKVRMQAATKLLEFQVATSKEINTQNMQNMIAEIKLNRDAGGLRGIGYGDASESSNVPLVDFGTIKTID